MIFLWCVYIATFINVVSPTEFFFGKLLPNNFIIGNLRRRAIIPLNQINTLYGFTGWRRVMGNPYIPPILSYRRTKDIRQPDRTFEITESQLSKSQLDNKEELEKLHNQLRWLTIDTDGELENKVHVAKLKPKTSTTSFQQALRITVIIGQMFSLLPVAGVFSDNVNNVKFVKTSWKCLYSLLSVIAQMFMAVLCINRLAHSIVTLNGTSPTIFYVTTCVTMAMFFQVGRRWPQLVQHITMSEDMDPMFDTNLNRKCKITCAVVLLLALFEHILSLLSAFAGAAACYPDNRIYEGFVIYFYPWVFNCIPYSPFLGFVTQFLHFQSTFIWNFSDLFVICMSYYLTSRLNNVNKTLLGGQGKYLPEVFWRATREHYCRVTQVVRKVDEVISGIVFISFANNMFFICLQLFNTLENGLKGTVEGCNAKSKRSGPLGGHEAATYFLFSLAFLLSRSIAVSLIASEVSTASSVPATVLYDVPSPVYCVEVQRFLDQVNGDKVALSGLQFFLVTRGLLLTVAGTIVTYELVMFQFNSPSSATNSSSSILPNVSSTIITTVAVP